MVDLGKVKWGSPQHWGTLKVRYKPTGDIKELKLGIRRMGYHNELIFCEAWGYDSNVGGAPADSNNPDNWEVLEVKPKKATPERAMWMGVDTIGGCLPCKDILAHAAYHDAVSTQVIGVDTIVSHELAIRDHLLKLIDATPEDLKEKDNG